MDDWTVMRRRRIIGAVQATPVTRCDCWFPSVELLSSPVDWLTDWYRGLLIENLIARQIMTCQTVHLDETSCCCCCWHCAVGGQSVVRRGWPAKTKHVQTNFVVGFCRFVIRVDSSGQFIPSLFCWPCEFNEAQWQQPEHTRSDGRKPYIARLIRWLPLATSCHPPCPFSQLLVTDAFWRAWFLRKEAPSHHPHDCGIDDASRMFWFTKHTLVQPEDLADAVALTISRCLWLRCESNHRRQHKLLDLSHRVR